MGSCRTVLKRGKGTIMELSIEHVMSVYTDKQAQDLLIFLENELKENLWCDECDTLDGEAHAEGCHIGHVLDVIRTRLALTK
jgi:hypothetical protein